MNIKFTFAHAGSLLTAAMFLMSSLSLKADEFAYSKLYGGAGAGTELPDYSHWHYFAFDEKQGVILLGTSDFELENLNAGKVGTEKINAEWQARTDWDFAFHAGDFRTNSGAAGNAKTGAVFIADEASAGATPLADLYAALAKAPKDAEYNADVMAVGTFYLSLTAMPPTRATSLSVSAATRKAVEGAKGASADFYAMAMQGGAKENPMIIVLKTVSGKYVKIFLKQFVEDGKPGFLKFDYSFIPLEGATSTASVQSAAAAVYPNPVSETLNIRLSEASSVKIYSLVGSLVKTIHAASPQQLAIPVSGWAKGIYIVKIDSAGGSQLQKVIVK